MFNIKHYIRLDLPSMKLMHIYCFSSHETKVTLLYGMYLTKVFWHFELDFLGEPTTKLYFTYNYIHKSYSCMLYTIDLTWHAYHRVIAK